MAKNLGIFIPIELIQNDELDWLNKILLTEIISLSSLRKGCIASNQRLSDFLQIDKSSIHRRIKFLVDKDYITTENKYSGKKCIGRVIKPTGKLMVSCTNLMVAEDTTMVAQNTTMVAENTINGGTEHHSMVAQSYPSNSFINSGNSVSNTVINSGSNSEVDLDSELNKLLVKLKIK